MDSDISFKTYGDFRRQVMYDIQNQKMEEGEFWPGAVFIQNKQDTFFIVDIDDISKASELEDVTMIVADLVKANSPKYLAVVYPSWQMYEIEGDFEEVLAMSLLIGNLSDLEYYESLPYTDEDEMLTLGDWGDCFDYDLYPGAAMWIRRAQVGQG